MTSHSFVEFGGVCDAGERRRGGTREPVRVSIGAEALLELVNALAETLAESGDATPAEQHEQDQGNDEQLGSA
jgi:hypothetical protein